MRRACWCADAQQSAKDERRWDAANPVHGNSLAWQAIDLPSCHCCLLVQCCRRRQLLLSWLTPITFHRSAGPDFYVPPLIGGGIKRCFCLMSDVCLTYDVCLSRTSGLSREQRGLGRPKCNDVTWRSWGLFQLRLKMRPVRQGGYVLIGVKKVVCLFLNRIKQKWHPIFRKHCGNAPHCPRKKTLF